MQSRFTLIAASWAAALALAAACGGGYSADEPARDASVESTAPPPPGDDDASPSHDAGDASDGAVDTCATLGYGTSDGTVAAGETDCAGSKVQLAFSQHNCGACGHDCGTSACVNGLCQPELLLPGSDIDNVLGVGGGRVFYGQFNTPDGGTYVATAPIDGGTASVFMFQPAGASVVFRATFSRTMAAVFWNAGPVFGKVYGASNPTTLVPDDPGNAEATSLSLNATHLYYAVNAKALSRVAVTGGNPETLASAYEINDIAADDTGAYWVEPTADGSVAGVPGTVAWYDASKDSIARSQPFGKPLGVATDGTHVYVLDGATGNLLRYPAGKAIATAAPEKLGRWMGTVAATRRVAVDTTGIYVQIDDGQKERVVRYPLCGGAPVLLAFAGATAPFALDATYLYVAQINGIYRVAK